MIVGVLKEIKTKESRVAMTPAGAEQLVARGHTVYVETRAGEGSGFTDSQYQEVGAAIQASPTEIYATCAMVMKVKEPLPVEYPLIRRGQVVFTYFHFAASEELTRAIIQSGCTAVAYETVKKPNGSLPLLTPMSEVAGKMAVHEGANISKKLTAARANCWAACRGWTLARCSSWAAEWSASMPPRSPAGWGPRYICWTPTWSGCAT